MAVSEIPALFKSVAKSHGLFSAAQCCIMESILIKYSDIHPDCFFCSPYLLWHHLVKMENKTCIGINIISRYFTV